MGDRRTAYRVFVAKSEGRRLLGRPCGVWRIYKWKLKN
jgi:hypothetical protein